MKIAMPHWAILLAIGVILYMLFFHVKTTQGDRVNDATNKVKSLLADNPATNFVTRVSY